MTSCQSALHVHFGIWLSDAVGDTDLAVDIGLATVGMGATAPRRFRALMTRCRTAL